MAVNEVISGTVTRINHTGFQVAEREGWLTISQHAQPRPPLPTRVGARVSATIDKRGFVYEVVEGGQDPIQAPSEAVRSGCAHDAVSVRIAAVQAAAAFLAPRPEAKSADVLSVADRFVEWIGGAK